MGRGARIVSGPPHETARIDPRRIARPGQRACLDSRGDAARSVQRSGRRDRIAEPGWLAPAPFPEDFDRVPPGGAKLRLDRQGRDCQAHNHMAQGTDPPAGAADLECRHLGRAPVALGGPQDVDTRAQGRVRGRRYFQLLGSRTGLSRGKVRHRGSCRGRTHVHLRVRAEVT